MGRVKITGRIDDLEAACGLRINHALLRQIAIDEGISEAELQAEAALVAGVCHRQGITTVAGMIAYQAGELGIPVDELEAEIAQIRERAG